MREVKIAIGCFFACLVLIGIAERIFNAEPYETTETPETIETVILTEPEQEKEKGEPEIIVVAPTVEATETPVIEFNEETKKDTGEQEETDTTPLNGSQDEILTSLGTYYITGYDPYCVHCCSKSDGIMANGEICVPGIHCASGTEFDFGTVLYIEGLGEFIVGDRGVGNGVIDIACVDHAACYAITGHYEVFLVEE